MPFPIVPASARGFFLPWAQWAQASLILALPPFLLRDLCSGFAPPLLSYPCGSFSDKTTQQHIASSAILPPVLPCACWFPPPTSPPNFPPVPHPVPIHSLPKFATVTPQASPPCHPTPLTVHKRPFVTSAEGCPQHTLCPPGKHPQIHYTSANSFRPRGRQATSLP